jgi:hypothetical protein
MSGNAADLAKCLRDLNRRAGEASDFSDQAGDGSNVSLRNDYATSGR